MKIIQKLWLAAGLPCPACGGRGYGIAPDVAKFIDANGLDTFQAATTLMTNEDLYGGLGSLGVSAWEELGMPPDQAEFFVCEVAHIHHVQSCPACRGRANHPAALSAAEAVLGRWIADRRQSRAEHEARRTPAERRQRRLHGMHVAIRYSETSRKSLAQALEEESPE